MTNIFPMYLTNYTNVEFVLAYDFENGNHATMPASVALAQGIREGHGFYVEVDKTVYGVFSSPTGPVIFRDGIRIAAILGTTVAKVMRDVAPRRHHFELIHNNVVVFAIEYGNQGYLYANPYDTEIEDVDLFALLEKRLCDDSFYKNYTRP
jgi:hypothetical protein